MAKKPSIKKEFPNETSGPRVVVKFRAGLGLTADSLVEGRLAREDLGPWQELTVTVPGIRLRAVFEFESIDFQALIRRATELDPTYQPADLSSYYYVDAPPATDLNALVLALRKWNNVELVYIANAGPDPGVNASNDYRSPNQGYLDPTPDGIDAEYAWGFAGGDGAGQRLLGSSCFSGHTKSMDAYRKDERIHSTERQSVSRLRCSGLAQGENSRCRPFLLCRFDRLRSRTPIGTRRFQELGYVPALRSRKQQCYLEEF